MPALTFFSSSAPLSQRQSISSSSAQDHDHHHPESTNNKNTFPSASSPIPTLMSASRSAAPKTQRQASRSPTGTEPISEFDNPDAIALRSTISILQIQREQSKTDLCRLEELKHEAVANAEAYKDDLAKGRIRSGPGSTIHFGPEIGDVTHHRHGGAGSRQPQGAEDQVMKDDSDGDEEVNDAESEDADETTTNDRPSQFGVVPTPQNIVRCPPVNWAKYHVVGESLDKLHEEQRLRPSQGQPHSQQQDASTALGSTTMMNDRTPEALIAAPYRPLIDKPSKGESMRTRSGGKKN